MIVQQTLQQREYLPKDGAYPFAGLSTLEPSTQLDPSLSPTFTNVLPNKGLVTKRRGYAQLGGNLNGTPLALVNFQTPAGTEYLVCITTTREYKYNTGTGAWDNITAAAGDRTGGETDVVNWTVATGTQGTWLIITNGKDKPRYWNGTGNFDLLENAAGWAFTGFVTCKSLAMFYNHLVLVGVTTGSSQPYSIYWSDTDSLVNFNTGTSGSILVSDSQGIIQQALPLGDRLIIYFDNSIGTLTHIGGDTIYIYETLIQDSRLVSARAIVNMGPYHILMRTENISVFDGTRALRDIGDPVKRTYREEIDLDNHTHAFAFLDRAKNRIYFGVPTASSTTIFYMVEYDPFDLSKLAWCRLEFALRVTSMGFYSRDASLTWDSASLSGITWAELAFAWDNGSIDKGFPVVVLGTSNSQVQLYDEVRLKDGSTDISATWDSPDFTSPAFQSQRCRWLEIELDLRGESVVVSYSTDRGGSWTSLGTVTLTADFQKQLVNLDVNARTLRVRVTSTKFFEAQWRRVWYMPQGAR